MDLMEQIQQALKAAMKAKDALRLSTLRLMNAAIKDQAITTRTNGIDMPMDAAAIIAILSKMVKQRQESTRAYQAAGRLELAEREAQEIKVIEDFLPARLTSEEVEAAIESALQTVGAKCIRDMGKVMAALKAQHAGQIDFEEVGKKLKARLS